MQVPQTVSPLPLFRRGIIDYLDEAKYNNTISIIYEIDISKIRPAIRRYRRANGTALSLSTYLLWVFTQTLDKYKYMQAYRRGRKIVIFDDVDVSTMVERNVDGMLTTTSYVIRKANEKEMQTIEEEIAAARKDTVQSAFTRGKGKRNIGTLFARLPRFMRRGILRYMMRHNPELRKKLFGTVSFSALHMFSNQKGWGVPLTPHAVNFLLGGIGKTPAVENGKLIEKDTICATVTMNHDLNDGAQGVRFMVAFLNNLKKCYGLENYLEKA